MAREMLSINQAAARYGVHPNTVRRWLKVGAVSGTKNCFGYWLIPVKDIERVMCRNGATEGGSRPNVN